MNKKIIVGATGVILLGYILFHKKNYKRCMSGGNEITLVDFTYDGTQTQKDFPTKPFHLHIVDGVTSITEEAFKNCVYLTTMYIPLSVESIESRAFSGCTSLTIVYIPSSVKSIGDNAFSECSSLHEVDITSVKSIGDNAFAGCSSLQQVDMPETVTNIGIYAFSDHTSLKRTKVCKDYSTNYLYHDKRMYSPFSLYAENHNLLLYIKKLPCFICGKKHSSNDPLITHHFYCEKAAQNSVDWKMFGEFAKNCYNIQTGENIGANFDWDKVEKNPELFVDSTQNLIVLCNEHHMSKNRGIHYVPFPEWILQKYPKDGFEFLV